MSASPTRSMSAVVKAVLCGGVDMKLRRVLLSGCMSCTRMYLPPCGNFSSKRLLSLLRPFSPGMERTRTAILKDAVPCGNVNVGLRRKSCSAVTPTALCSRTAPVSRCRPRRCYSAVMGNGNLLEGSAPQPGENGMLKVMFEGGNHTKITQHDNTLITSTIKTWECSKCL